MNEKLIEILEREKQKADTLYCNSPSPEEANYQRGIADGLVFAIDRINELDPRFGLRTDQWRLPDGTVMSNKFGNP